MADKKISALTASTTPLAGTEVLPIVQGGSTVKVSVADLTAGRSVAASLLTTTAASAIGTTADENVGFLLVDSSNKSYTITARGNDQANARVRIKNTGTGGEDYAFVAGQNNIGNVGLSLFKVGVGTSLLLDDGSGNFKVSGGNVVIGTAAKGIDFSANANAPGMTSELLNWYETGTWTPTDGSGAGLALTVANATYTRIGRLVTANFAITYPATADVTNARIGGLPFASSSAGFSFPMAVSTCQTGICKSGLVDTSATTFLLLDTTATPLTNVQMSGLFLRGTVIYEV
jgi:hypothetical protein